MLPVRKRSTFNPLQEVSDMMDTFSTAMDRAMRSYGVSSLNTVTARFIPPLDVTEYDTHYMVSVELPGISKEDVHINLTDDNTIIISGEKKDYIDEGTNHLSEVIFGSFRRQIYLPKAADLDKVEATQTNGVLTIKVSKMAKTAAREVEIK